MNEELSDFLCAMFKASARLSLRRGLKLQEAEEALKKAFVSVAEEELLSAGNAVSVSRVSVMTGLHRRDVARFLSAELVESDGRGDEGLLMRVIGQWQSDRKFRIANGKARPLTYEGMESEFVELVRSVNREFNPYTVLFELERLGAVKRENELLSLQVDVFNPSGSVRDGLRLLSGDVTDLVDAVSDNIFHPQSTPHLHIKTEYDNVSAESLPTIKEWFIEKGGEFHKEARSYLSKFDKDLNPKLAKKEGGARVAIGTFSIVQTPKLGREDEKK